MKKTINYLFASAGITALLFIAGCSKKTELPAIDGYNNSNEVGAANLVAHWSFDSNQKEDISGTAPTATFGTVGSTTGQIGNALNLTKGALVYPSLPKLADKNALNNYTVSIWVNVKNNKATANAGFTAFFGLAPTVATDIWPDVVLCAETGNHLASSDTLELKPLLNTHPDGGGNSLQDNLAVLNSGTGKGQYFLGAGKWIHYVARWNGATHQHQIFANGVSVGAYDDRGTTGVEIMQVPVLPVFGSLISKDIGFTSAGAQPGFNPWATAMVDDVRVYNTTLSDTDIAALFHLGTAGR